MRDKDFIDVIVNALGSHYFDVDKAVEQIAEKAEQVKESGEIPGDLWTLANILPQIAEEAKKRYLK